LAYADDVVQLASSWIGMQKLLTILFDQAAGIGISYKTVAMVFSAMKR